MEALEGFNRYRVDAQDRARHRADRAADEPGQQPRPAAHRPLTRDRRSRVRSGGAPGCYVARMARSRAACATLAVALLGSAGWGWWSGGRAAARFDATVVHVVDGDTIVVDVGGPRPSGSASSAPTRPRPSIPAKPVQCYGPEASAHTKHGSRPGRAWSLETDAEVRDKYGRLLAYVYVGGRRYDDELLRLGLRAAADHPAQRRARPGDVERRARSPGRVPRPVGRVLSRRCVLVDPGRPNASSAGRLRRSVRGPADVSASRPSNAR